MPSLSNALSVSLASLASNLDRICLSTFAAYQLRGRTYPPYHNSQVLEDLSLGGEYTDGDRGQVAEATVTYDVSDDHSTYLTYVDDNYEGQNNVIVGQRADLTSSVDFYQENQFVDENDGHGRIDSYGFGYDVTEDVEMGIGYQLGEIEDDQNITTERESISFNASIDLDDITLSHKFEYRVDKSEDDPEIAQRELQQIVTTNRYTHHLTEEYTLFGKYNYSITESETTGETMAQFTEATGGLAYRPIYNDRLNLLSRYTYIADFDDCFASYLGKPDKIYQINNAVPLWGSLFPDLLFLV